MPQALAQQQYIVDIAFNKEPIPQNSKGLQAYRFLVEYRFFEVLSNAFPVFYGLVEQKRFEKAVIDFMQSGAKSNEMWRVPNEFRKFVKKENYFDDMVYVNDLLWFEWTEVSLMMKKYNPQAQESFSWEDSYDFSKSAKLKKLAYPVFEKGRYEEQGEYYLLAYYDFEAQQVYFREIALPLYLFLKCLKKRGIEQALHEIAQMSGEGQESVKSFFKDSLEELHSLQVIRKK